jgi:elongation factor P--beta-lysine ligase
MTLSNEQEYYIPTFCSGKDIEKKLLVAKEDIKNCIREWFRQHESLGSYIITMETVDEKDNKLLLVKVTYFDKTREEELKKYLYYYRTEIWKGTE